MTTEQAQTRLKALKEDRKNFGLTSSEEAEFIELKREVAR